MKAPKLVGPAAKADTTYEVGYAKPPTETRFKPGRSGNLKGRPRGAKNKRPALNEERLKDIVLEEAYRNITVRDGDRNVSIPMAQAVVRSMAVNAAKGQHRAQRLFAEMLSSTERQNKQLADDWLNTAMEYKVEWERELHRREMLGITNLPSPLPHPDQVKIDMNTGLVHIEGPATKEQLAQVELWRGRQQVFKEELCEVEEMLKQERKPARVAQLQEEKLQVETVLEIIGQLLGKIDWNGQGGT
ncbi:hypothetical protein SAMN04488515_0206 [Cognatiyoonia koreensis]|uniref:DUF5681 domain-containing protein n=1 Tax=Cognatiyoonia koreensis TaxID=364200 RepID=A0A1I0MU22_9RHOB|nr:DUF5681 domain-containing protein [Cognatiyoonia koreensis]SEV91466.1 hypothetical protein SAMN04488515_0206 [Cognatiyoonia koreensis]